MQITYKLKDAFFDRPEVQRRLDRAKKKALGHAAGLVRKTARNSMRRRKSASKPGSPPSAHAKGVKSLKDILYAFDWTNDSAIVGPVGFNSQRTTIFGGSMTIPRLHEMGGTIVITESRTMPIGWVPAPDKTPQWRRVDGRRSKRAGPGYRIETRKRNATYPMRPFMNPALESQAPKFPDLFINSVK